MQPAVIEPGLELIVGLGNPGGKYDKTRHNAGFWFVDRLAARCGASFRAESKFHGETAAIRHGDRLVYLLKPATFMNNSGRAVAAIARFYKVPVDHILIAHDELDLPPGAVKLKRGGGHGGHNGLRDMAALGSPDFWRLRVGIGHPGDKHQVVDYVLKQPSKDDRELIDAAIDKSLDVADLMLDGQMEKAMHKLHSA